MRDIYYCICGLPGSGSYSDSGAFCSQKCRGVAAYMSRTRAKEEAWLIKQKWNVQGLTEALDGSRPVLKGVASLL